MSVGGSGNAVAPWSIQGPQGQAAGWPAPYALAALWRRPADPHGIWGTPPAVRLPGLLAFGPDSHGRRRQAQPMAHPQLPGGMLKSSTRQQPESPVERPAWSFWRQHDQEGAQCKLALQWPDLQPDSSRYYQGSLPWPGLQTVPRTERLCQAPWSGATRLCRQGSLVPLITRFVSPEGWLRFSCVASAPATPKHLKAAGPRAKSLPALGTPLEVGAPGRSMCFA